MTNTAEPPVGATSVAEGDARRRDLGVPIAAAAGAAIFMVIAVLVQQLTMLLSFIGQAPSEAGLGEIFWGGLVDWVVLTVVPFVVGYALFLILIAPIEHAVRVRTVVVRAVGATGAGALVVLVTRAIVGLIRAASFDRSLFSNSFPNVDFVGTVPGQLVMAVQGAIVQFVTLLPLAVLAAVLAWMWRGRSSASVPPSGSVPADGRAV